LGEEFDKKTNDRDFLDLEEDGLDRTLSQSLGLFEEREVLWKTDEQQCIKVSKIVQGIRVREG
jgi:hypothetical protein